MRKISRAVLSCLGIGYLPFGQGTWASIVGVLIAVMISSNYILAGSIVCLVGIGFFLIHIEKLTETDPPWIVIDEICGMMVTYLCVPRTPAVMLAGFVLFRIFDISKIFPIGKLEKLKGPGGILLDDIAAGIFANIALQVLLKFASSILV